MILTRRGLLGMFAAGTAAAIIRTPGLLMPVKPVWIPFSTDNFTVKCRHVWTSHNGTSFNAQTGKYNHALQYQVLDGVRILVGDPLVLDKNGYVRPMRDMSERMIGVALETVL